MRPAYETKDVSVLKYRIAGHCYTLHQSDVSGETGSTLWLSSQILATYLSLTFSTAKPDSTTKAPRRRQRGLGRVLELGSGIGLLALVVRDLGYHVTASDYDALMPLLKHNITFNSTLNASGEHDGHDRIECRCIDWTTDESTETYDSILMTDVIYSPALIQPLCATILRHSAKGSVIYLAQEVRTPDLIAAFLDLCAKHMKIATVSETDMEKVVAALNRISDDDDDDDDDKNSQNAINVHRATDEADKDRWSGVSIYKMTRK